MLRLSKSCERQPVGGILVRSGDEAANRLENTGDPSRRSGKAARRRRHDVRGGNRWRSRNLHEPRFNGFFATQHQDERSDNQEHGDGYGYEKQHHATWSLVLDIYNHHHDRSVGHHFLPQRILKQIFPVAWIEEVHTDEHGEWQPAQDPAGQPALRGANP